VVQGHQGTGAGGVHDEAGALEIEGVGDPVGEHGPRTSRQAVAIDAARLHIRDLVLRLHEGQAYVDARPTAPQLGGIDARIDDRLVGQLQQHPHTGIHQLRLLLVHAEELVVELLQIGVLHFGHSLGESIYAC